MKIIKTIIAAFAMFSALPMPAHDWDDDNTKYMLVAFPLVGAVQGLLLWGAYSICDHFAFPVFLKSAVFFIIPILYTGGIHLDGFMDVSDALASNEDKEKRLKIMSDPHVGAFAVIAFAVYCIAGLALWSAIKTFEPVLFILMYMLSRSLAGFAMLTFSPAKSSGLASYFSKAGSRSAAGALSAVIAIFISIALIICGERGIYILLCALIMLLIYLTISKRKFGGITGDLSGWFLSLSELLMLAVYIITGYL